MNIQVFSPTERTLLNVISAEENDIAAYKQAIASIKKQLKQGRCSFEEDAEYEKLEKFEQRVSSGLEEISRLKKVVASDRQVGTVLKSSGLGSSGWRGRVW